MAKYLKDEEVNDDIDVYVDEDIQDLHAVLVDENFLRFGEISRQQIAEIIHM